MANTADAVVIGGGINGTNIAWWLAQRKVGKVVLLEKNAIASGASGKSGSLIGSHFGTELKVRLALKAMETWKNFKFPMPITTPRPPIGLRYRTFAIGRIIASP